MILESKYKLYLDNGIVETRLQIKLGIVFFERKVIISELNEVILINRTDNKSR